jgi:hypothetical protein
MEPNNQKNCNNEKLSDLATLFFIVVEEKECHISYNQFKISHQVNTKQFNQLLIIETLGTRIVLVAKVTVTREFKDRKSEAKLFNETVTDEWSGLTEMLGSSSLSW